MTAETRGVSERTGMQVREVVELIIRHYEAIFVIVLE